MRGGVREMRAGVTGCEEASGKCEQESRNASRSHGMRGGVREMQGVVTEYKQESLNASSYSTSNACAGHC